MSNHHNDHNSLDPRILAAAVEGCAESRMTVNRRAFMGISASLFTWAYMPRSALAAVEQPRLLIVVLRGGMDGLHMVPPLNDPNYQSARTSLSLYESLHANTSQKLDSTFYLHPSMPNFLALYRKKEAAVVNAIAPPLRVRSHFQCQYNLEAGLPGTAIRSSTSGWLNRLLQNLPKGNPVKVGGGLQVGPSPLILAGAETVLSWSPRGLSTPQAFTDRVLSLYQASDANLHNLLSSGEQVNAFAMSQMKASTASDNFSDAFSGAGRLLAAGNGPRIAVLSIDQWDTHVSQNGLLERRLEVLDRSLQEFKTALGEAAWKNTVVACVTEFGRTVPDYRKTGTDHGIGALALLMGGPVAGGRVITDWPGLGSKQLVEGRDLQATYDLRQLFKGILRDHLGVPLSILEGKVFPESADVKPLDGLLASKAETISSASASLSSDSSTGTSAIARYRRQAL